jgi:hypothetical protein
MNYCPVRVKLNEAITGLSTLLNTFSPDINSLFVLDFLKSLGYVTSRPFLSRVLLQNIVLWSESSWGTTFKLRRYR